MMRERREEEAVTAAYARVLAWHTDWLTDHISSKSNHPSAVMMPYAVQKRPILLRWCSMLYVADGSEKRKIFMYCLIPTDMSTYYILLQLVVSQLHLN